MMFRLRAKQTFVLEVAKAAQMSLENVHDIASSNKDLGGLLVFKFITTLAWIKTGTNVPNKPIFVSDLLNLLGALIDSFWFCLL